MDISDINNDKRVLDSIGLRVRIHAKARNPHTYVMSVITAQRIQSFVMINSHTHTHKQKCVRKQQAANIHKHVYCIHINALADRKKNPLLMLYWNYIIACRFSIDTPICTMYIVQSIERLTCECVKGAFAHTAQPEPKRFEFFCCHLKFIQATSVWNVTIYI